MNQLTIGLLSLGLLCANACADDFNTQPPTESIQSMPLTETSRKAEGEAFLAANKVKPGVVTTASGLQYKVIAEGSGPEPSDSDKVTVHYAGTLVNGKEFDSSYKRGQAAVFPVGAVIPGWIEAFKLMKVASKWEVYIPAALAYGEGGAPPMIGPGEALIFTIELIGINPQ